MINCCLIRLFKLKEGVSDSFPREGLFTRSPSPSAVCLELGEVRASRNGKWYLLGGLYLSRELN